jgi:hypothetical protein
MIRVAENQVIDQIPIKKGPIEEAAIMPEKGRVCILRRGEAIPGMVMVPDSSNLVLVINVEQKVITILNAITGRREDPQSVMLSIFQECQLKLIVVTIRETYVICQKT